ncbi:hypothetical protein AURDEDRAFT_181369 [Auricularia subglabra TFB-10046 SS5]|nr:hypothetical protein AURDEDRAFT_181369 [Auricularia subglabra TFB-10046 SS5]
MATGQEHPSLLPIYEHNSSPEKTLLPRLHAHLPYPLPVYRRVQFPLHGEHMHVLATFRPAESNQNDDHDLNTCIGAAYIDRSRRPETDAWIFLSWDNPAHAPPVGTCTCETLLASLLHHVATTIPFPPLSTDEEADALAAVAADGTGATAAQFHTHSANAAAYLTDLHERAILKVGALHARSAPVLDARGWLRRDKPGLQYAYRKYVFPASSPAADDPPPPEGLRWGAIRRDEDISLARSRTAIPRRHRTLKLLPSAALFPVEGGEDAQPVAWAFLGPDGSLISLHVEPAYRGRGLAKAVGRRVLHDGVARFGDALGGLAHADVAVENAESNGVCRSLGGAEGWTVYWVRVDLDKVPEAFAV